MRAPWHTTRQIAIVVLASCFSCAANAHDFEATGLAVGDLVLGFTTSSISASFEATVDIQGNMCFGGEVVGFTGSGSADGSGAIELASGDVRAWIVIAVDGLTDTGEFFILRGGATLIEGSGTAATTGLGSGSGHFDFQITTPAGTVRAWGTLDGTASGRFVIPRDSLTMQLEGTASFDMKGSVRSLEQPDDTQPLPPETDPLETALWPEDLATQLRQTLEQTSANI